MIVLVACVTGCMLPVMKSYLSKCISRSTCCTKKSSSATKHCIFLYFKVLQLFVALVPCTELNDLFILPTVVEENSCMLKLHGDCRSPCAISVGNLAVDCV